MKTTITSDFSKFGFRERKLAEVLLTAWNEKGLPNGFLDDEVSIIFNTSSGNVFLTNADFQVAMMNGDKLENFYTDFETGEEGFKDELSKEALSSLGLINSSKMVEVPEIIIDGARFNRHDILEIEQLLTAWTEGNLPEDFSFDGMKIVSFRGGLMLTNTSGQFAVLDGFDIRTWKFDPETGELGFEE